jgi:RHS repeat-associated protein
MLANGSDVPFAWSYLPGSDLKSSLAYPNGLTASWTYDANGQLLQVRNATPTDVISQYDYTYDAAGRRIKIARSGSAMSESRTDAYGYNVRGELTSATGQGGQPSSTAAFDHSYQYDNIGNRLTSMDLGCSRAYTSNGLNQYTDVAESPSANAPQGAVEEFEPLYDDDGNQTLVKTTTGVWSVLYNGENRPVLWTRAFDGMTVSMAFDRMGRRVRCHETGGTAAGSVMTFAYDGYVCVARRRHGTNGASVIDRFVWDPAEPVATRPLAFCMADSAPQYYAHDGNKNVSELVSVDGAATAHYEYAPFGAVTYSAGPSAASNPYRFSSEYADASLSLVYYNFRHYNTIDGRWCSRDTSMELGAVNLYLMSGNDILFYFDYLGLSWLDGTPGLPPAEVGLGESFIPIYGSLREFEYALYNGKWGMAAFSGMMAVADAFLVGSLAKGIAKGCLKITGHSWRATRQWFIKTRGITGRVEVHHAYVPQRIIKKYKWLEPIANQPWNFTVFEPIPSLNLSAHQVHLAAGHSCSVFSTVKNATVHFSVYQRYWYKYSMGSKMVHVYIVDRVSFTAYSWIDKCIDENVHTFINDVFNESLQEVTEETEFLNSDLTPFTPIYNWDFK